MLISTKIYATYPKIVQSNMLKTLKPIQIHILKILSQVTLNNFKPIQILTTFIFWLQLKEHQENKKST